MKPEEISALLAEHQFRYVTGVPDSVFKNLLECVHSNSAFEHYITNNEGESCALAAGYHLATGKVPLVYMQNSGLGNCINPLTSLLDSHIYSIPTLLLIAWRGKPGEKDEPQHKRMGSILPGMLSLMDIQYAIADQSIDHLASILKEARHYFSTKKKPFAILFPKNSILSSESTKKPDAAIPAQTIIREKMLECLVQQGQDNDIFVTTTGKTSRELYEIRARNNQGHERDFLTVGSMGCASSIALGIALQRPQNRVILIDGDGACLMRLEAMTTIGYTQPKNLIHVLVDNNAYESTGSQKTLSSNVDFEMIAKACNYASTACVKTLEIFSSLISSFEKGPALWVVKTHAFSRADLARPKSTPIENKQAFMRKLGVSE